MVYCILYQEIYQYNDYFKLYHDIYAHSEKGSKRDECADQQVDGSKRGKERVGANGEGMGEVLSSVA